jgi:hypothetical protein
MIRPAVEVADLLLKQGDRFMDQSPWLDFQQLSVLRAITRCRTAALGGHIDQCSQCGHQAISYNSCRNRHCPKCQAQARQRWLAAREKELLAVPYFHVVFTLPHALNPLCLRNARVLYDLLFRASADTMLEVAANPKRLGAQIGFISILHTWGQNLLLHPHVHCMVPAGGLSPDHRRWIHPKYAFFLPVDVLSSVFRAKFVRGLRKAFRQGKLVFPGSIAELARPKRFAAFVDSLFQQKWVVYAKPAFGAPTGVLRYLGRYVNRRSEGLWQAQLFSNPSENALLLVRLEVLDSVDNRADCFEIILRGVHLSTFLINDKRKEALLFYAHLPLGLLPIKALATVCGN